MHSYSTELHGMRGYAIVAHALIEGENRAYHQLGNAVCPPVIKAIAEAILHSLGILPMVHRKQ